MDDLKKTERVLAFIEDAAIQQAKVLRHFGLLLSLEKLDLTGGCTLEDLETALDEEGNLAPGSLRAGGLIPIQAVLAHYRHLVAELGDALQRKFELLIEDEGVSLERPMLDALQVSLTQLIRNAIALDLDSSESRSDAGKPEALTLKLKATQEGETVLLQLEDDGRGLSPADISLFPDMQAVRENVERLSGTLVIESQPADGSRISIRLPRSSGQG